jgi:hypothetical protein
MNARYGFTAEHNRSTATPRGAAARDISILGLIEWAFQRECAQLDFDEMRSTAGERPAVSPLWVLAQQRHIGCKIDGGGKSEPHPDADIVASALAALPDARGGRRMGLWIAELARAGARPDWMKDAVTRCLPVEKHKNNYGWHAKSEPCGSLEVQSRGRNRVVELRWCPVTFSPTASQIASARRAYLNWWDALHDLRFTFQSYGGLTAWRVTDHMPPRKPWVKSS